MGKHTSGPWHTGQGKAATIIYDQGGDAIADAKIYHNGWHSGTSEANAKLLAAAPDMLRMCQESLTAILHFNASDPLIAELTNVINKAGGYEVNKGDHHDKEEN